MLKIAPVQPEREVMQQALKQPGNVLSGLHQVILWIVAYYLWLVRAIFGGG
jgi:hypothetical protein